MTLRDERGDLTFSVGDLIDPEESEKTLFELMGTIQHAASQESIDIKTPELEALLDEVPVRQNQRSRVTGISPARVAYDHVAPKVTKRRIRPVCTDFFIFEDGDFNEPRPQVPEQVSPRPDFPVENMSSQELFSSREVGSDSTPNGRDPRERSALARNVDEAPAQVRSFSHRDYQSIFGSPYPSTRTF